MAEEEKDQQSQTKNHYSNQATNNQSSQTKKEDVLKPQEKEISLKAEIRTMAEDLEAAKKGTIPETKSLEIKIPLSETTPLEAQEKPDQTPISQTPSSKTQEIKLGPIEKTKLLPPLPPKPETRPKEISPPEISIPSPKKSLFSPKILIIIILIILIGFLGLFFIKRKNEKITENRPSPTLTETPTKTPVELKIKDLFDQVIVIQITIPSSLPTDQGLKKFQESIESIPIETVNEFGVLDITDENGNKYPLSSILEKISVPLPNEVLRELDQEDWGFYVYRQKEFFNINGTLNYNAPQKLKLNFIAKVKNESDLRSALNLWELKATNDLKGLFNLLMEKAASETFLDNTYQGISIRYRNFPFADNTIDYAIIPATDQFPGFFVLTNSRESIYSVIDLILDKIPTI